MPSLCPVLSSNPSSLQVPFAPRSSLQVQFADDRYIMPVFPDRQKYLRHLTLPSTQPSSSSGPYSPSPTSIWPTLHLQIRPILQTRLRFTMGLWWDNRYNNADTTAPAVRSTIYLSQQQHERTMNKQQSASAWRRWCGRSVQSRRTI